MIEQVGLALALAAPVGVLVAVAAARWLARRAVARVDALIAAAMRMTVEDLRHRLPVSTPGDGSKAEPLSSTWAGRAAHEREQIFGPFVRGNTPAADRVVGRAGLDLARRGEATITVVPSAPVSPSTACCARSSRRGGVVRIGA